MSILENDNQILVPNHQVHYDHDITAITGYVYLNNTKKSVIPFNTKKHVKHYTPSKGELKNSKSKNWTIPVYEKELQTQPNGAYIATTMPSNALLYAPKESAANVKYVTPLFDLWSRCKYQPNVFYLSKTMVNLNNFKTKLQKRGYITNLNKSTNVDPVLNIQFVDLLPNAYNEYYQNNEQSAINLIQELTKSLLIDKDSTIMQIAMQNIFIFSILMFFKQLKVNQDTDIKHANLKKAIKFFKATINTHITQKTWTNLSKRFKVDLDLNFKSRINLLYCLLKLEATNTQAKDQPTNFTNTIASSALALFNSSEMFDLTTDHINKCLDKFTNECQFMHNTIYPDLIANVLGQTLDIYVGKHYTIRQDILVFNTSNQAIMVKPEINGWIRVNISTLDLNKPIYIKLPDKYTPQKLDLQHNPNIITHLNNKPLFIALYNNPSLLPILSNYNNMLIDSLYSIIANTSYTGYASQKPLRSSKYILDFRNKANIQLPKLDTMLTSGLGILQQFTLLFENQEQMNTQAKINNCVLDNNETITSNCFTQINLNKHDFYVQTDYDGKLVNPDYQELPLFEDHDSFDLSIKDNLIDKQVNAKLSKLLHEHNTLTRLEKLELALLEQQE